MAFEIPIARYETREQLEAIRYQEPRPSMFLNTFFKGGDIISETETLEYDEVFEGNATARYVGPRLSVEATEREGFQTREIHTPKCQEKRVLDSEQLLKRLPGENIYQGMTPAQRAGYFRDSDYVFCMNSIDNLREIQASELMTKGRIDILGRGIDAYVDYDLPLNLVLSGTDCWDAGGDVFGTLKMMSQTLRRRNYNPNMVLKTSKVMDVLMKDPTYREMLDNLRMEMGQIAPGPITDVFETAQYFGKIKWPDIGHLDIYTYDGTYKQWNEATQEYVEGPYLDEGRLLMLTNEAAQNKFIHGLYTYMDENHNFVSDAGRYIPEWMGDREAGTLTLRVTSRPLAVPYKVDSWWTAAVLA